MISPAHLELVPGLRASGWVCLGERGGGTWAREGRPRVDTHPTQVKLGWEVRA